MRVGFGRIDWWRVFPVIWAVAVGCATGIATIVSGQTSTKWMAISFIVTAAIPFALLINDIKKLVLIALTLDIPLGIDIAIQNQGWHQGGPTGYMVSLTTFALVVGYSLWIIERKPRVRLFPTLTIPALLYLAMIVLSFYQSTHWLLSSFGLFLQVQLFLAGFYLANHINSQADISLVVNVAAICLVLESGLMILQYFTGASFSLGGLVSSAAMTTGTGGAGVTGERVSGTLGRPGNAALYLNSMFMLTLGAYMNGTVINKKLAMAAMSLGVAALVATSSRGGWVAFGVALLIVVMRMAWTKAGAQLVVVVLLGGAVLGLAGGDVISERLSTTSEDKSREELAFMANRIIQAYPWGVGENIYDLYMSDKYAHPNWVGHTLYPPHNRYLITWAQLGAQGLAAFLLLLAGPIWQARQWLFRNPLTLQWVALAIGLLGALVTHIVQMGSETFNAGPPVYLLWFVIALLTAANSHVEPAKTAPAGGYHAAGYTWPLSVPSTKESP